MTSSRRLGEHLRSSARAFVFLIAFLLPLLFLPWTIDALEVNKQTLFVLLSCAAAISWIGAMMAEKTVRVQRGWSNVLPLLLVGAFLVPAIFSTAPYVSWVGSTGQEYTSVLTVLSGAILFYVVANTFTERSSHMFMHTVLVLSSLLVAVLGVLSIFGRNVFPGALGDIMAFNSVGTVNLFASYLVVMSVFSLSAWVAHKKRDSLLHEGTLGIIEQISIFGLSLLTFLVLLIVDYWILWLLFVCGIATMFVFGFFKASYFGKFSRFWLPLVLLLAALPFWFWMTRPFSVELPLEVSLNTSASLSIAEQALASSSTTFGTGPGTYLFDYTQFHTPAINETDLWNTRFDRASSYALTLLPTVGYLGAAAMVLFCLWLFGRASVPLLHPKSKATWLESYAHTMPWLVLVLCAFLLPWNMTLVGFFFLFSALMASQILRNPAKRDFSKSPALGLFFSFVFFVLALSFFIGIFVTTQRYAAETAFAKAIEADRAGEDLQIIVKHLDRAATLNQYNDLYYRSLSGALLLRVDEELSGIDELDTLTVESQQYLQSLVAASVNAAVHATDLSPSNVLNWLTRGMIYREIVGIDSTAVEFAMKAYEQAIALEPSNPSNWTELGKSYLVYASSIEPLTLSDDPDTAEGATTDRAMALEAAEGAFNQAIELKPNYAPAHFQLGITYEYQGRLDDAVGKMESIVAYNPLDVGAHFQLGILYLQRNTDGDIERARVVLEKAVELAPSYSNARWFLAYAYELQGDLTDAIAQVEAVLELNPDNQLVLNRLDRLSRGELEQEVPEEVQSIE